MILLCCLMLTIHQSVLDQYHAAIASDSVKQIQDKPPDKQSPDKPKPPDPPPVKKETTVQWLLRCLGISSTPSAMKGEDDNLTGDIWLTDTMTQTSQRLTREGGYRSPIVLAGEAKVLAIKTEKVVEITIASRAVSPRVTIPGMLKLIGLNAADFNQVLFLSTRDGQKFSVGTLSLRDQRVETRELDQNSEEGRGMLAYLRGWDRAYDGGKSAVYTKAESKESLSGKIEWRDVYLKRDGRDTINVSNCDGVNCVQPSLSRDVRYVVYIKSDG